MAYSEYYLEIELNDFKIFFAMTIFSGSFLRRFLRLQGFSAALIKQLNCIVVSYFSAIVTEDNAMVEHPNIATGKKYL